jgi:hypothetical protein
MADIVEQVFDNPVRNLAATVLKAAAEDNFRCTIGHKNCPGTDHTLLQFWCDVVGVNIDAFTERVKQEGGITWRA